MFTAGLALIVFVVGAIALRTILNSNSENEVNARIKVLSMEVRRLKIKVDKCSDGMETLELCKQREKVINNLLTVLDNTNEVKIKAKRNVFLFNQKKA